MSKVKIKKQREEKLEEYKNKYWRALADYDNLVKRVAREREEWVKRGNEELIKRILPLIENLEEAQRYLKDPGLDLVRKKFWEILRAEGVEKVEVEGHRFDPKTMEAVEVVKGKKDGLVTKQLSPMYRVKGKVMIPARVVVGMGRVSQESKKKAQEELARGDYM